MTVSRAGLDAIVQREGKRLTMYKDSAGLPTIGVGHLLTKDELASGKITVPVDWDDGISDEVCDALLQRDLAWAVKAVRDLVIVPLNTFQFDALVSFVFNIGTPNFSGSTLLKLLNAGQYGAVPTQLRKWIYSARRVDPILVNRRESEVRQWNGGQP